MKNPPENPQGYDWRLRGPIYVAEDQVIAGTGGQVARKGARIIFLSQIKLAKHKVLTIPVPNASALLLGAAAKAYCAAESLRADNSIDGSLRKEVSFHNDLKRFRLLTGDDSINRIGFHCH